MSTLLQEMVDIINIVEGKRGRKKVSAKRVDRKKEAAPMPKNLAAKHSASKSGAGQHEDKTGTKAKRSRQKKQWKRDIRSEM